MASLNIRLLAASALAASTFGATALLAQGASPASARKVLTQDTYDRWRSIVAPTLSPNGEWVAYTLTPAAGDGEMIVRSTHAATEYRVPRGFTGRPMLVTTGTPFRAPSPRFSSDSRHAAFLAYATRGAFDSARVAKKKTQPPTRLVIVNLASGATSSIDKVATFALPRESAQIIVYALAKDSTSADSASRDTARALAGATPGGAARPVARDSGRATPRRLETGAPLVIRDLESGAETRVENVGEYVVDPRGGWVAYAIAARPDTANGIFVRDLRSGTTRQLLAGAGRYHALTTDSLGTQLAWVSDRDDHAARKPAYSLYRAPVNGAAAKVVAAGAFGRDTLISTDSVRFTQDGALLAFGVAPVLPDSIPADSLADKAVYDLWNYRDARLQPEQKLRIGADRKRAFLTVYRVAANRTIRVGTDSVPTATIGRDGRYALLVNESPYAIQTMWGEDASDAVVVDLATGARRVIARALPFPARLSDAGRFVVWFDSAGWHAHSLATGRTADLTAHLRGVRFDQETWDTPSTPPAWGIAGWTRGDAQMLVYDHFDVWSLDPTGAAAPVSVTDSAGARSRTELRVVRDREATEAAYAPDAQLLLAAVNEDTKASGFYRATLGARRAPERIVMADAMFGAPQRSRTGGEYLVTRETVADFPNLYVGT
ncbi:MAG TPA: hypothetical protein VGT98_10415, partial [Candidatus Elarobacter sp.]|nr:hypothetical protein [Candidatus Elarobacter sp.]